MRQVFSIGSLGETNFSADRVDRYVTRFEFEVLSTCPLLGGL